MADTARMAFASIGAHKLRSFLTIVGITIGIFSVIGVMTVVSALRGTIESGLSFLGANMFQFAKFPVVTVNGADFWKYQRRRNIDLEQARRYRRLMEGAADVVCLTAFSQSGQAFYHGRRTTPSVRYGGVDGNFLVANQYAIDHGRNLTGADVALGSAVALIGADIVRKLFPSEDPVGRRIKVNGHPYTVVGTLAAKGTSFGRSQDDIVVVPISRFLTDNGPRNYSLNIATQAPSPLVYAATMDQGITAMRIVRGLRPGQDNDFEVYSNDSLLAAFAKVADAVRAAALVISGIALVAAGVGIMNIMLVSVTERTKEIGVRKSIGARRSDLLTQFLLEAVAICLLGGVAGILLGVLAGDALALALHASVVFPWAWALIGLGTCTAIGVGFGFYPAARAARLDPIEALRYE
ncbi:MAG: ABC transporter permease [Opitutaceae bacterium]